MIALYPSKAQIEALLASPETGPVTMLNLLRFKQQATAPDEDMSGEKAYQRYAIEMRRLVESRGGRFLWVGRIDSQVMGEGAENFHVAAIGVHRAAGLEGQWLLATTTTRGE